MEADERGDDITPTFIAVSDKCPDTFSHVTLTVRHTFHFGVGLPLVVPASERPAVVLGALLRPEIHGIAVARLGVTQLVQSIRTLAEFSTVLRPSQNKQTNKTSGVTW